MLGWALNDPGMVEQAVIQLEIIRQLVTEISHRFNYIL